MSKKRLEDWSSAKKVAVGISTVHIGGLESLTNGCHVSNSGGDRSSNATKQNQYQKGRTKQRRG